MDINKKLNDILEKNTSNDSFNFEENKIKTNFKNLKVLNIDEIKITNCDKIILKELKEFPEKNIKIIDINDQSLPLFKSMKIDHIQQGSIGNCYFVSSVISFFNINPLSKLIFKKQNKKYICVNLFDNGIRNCFYLKKEILKIDNNFISMKSNDLWPIFLEKAYAILCNGYYKMASGSSLLSLRVLTGAPVIHYHFNNIEEKELWFFIKNNVYWKRPICCSTKILDDLDDKDKENVTVTLNHSFSLIDYYEDEDYKVIKLINPWGKYTYKNPYITLYPKKDFFKTENKGTFFIEFEKFLKFFNGISICWFDKDYYNVFTNFNLNSVNNNDNKLFYVELNEGHHYITVDQLYKRFVNLKDYSNTSIFLMVFKINEYDDYEYIDSILQNEDFSYLDLNLKKGKYIIFVNMPFSSNLNSFVLGIYSKFKDYKICSFDKNNLRKDFMKEVLISHSYLHKSEWIYKKQNEYFRFFKINKGLFYIFNKNLLNIKTTFNYNFVSNEKDIFYNEKNESVNKLKYEFIGKNNIDLAYLLILKNNKIIVNINGNISYNFIK